MLALGACKKQLDIKPVSSLQVPVSLTDFQALLDNYNVFNNSWPYAGTAGADDGFIPDATLATATVSLRNAYIWNRDVFNDDRLNDWSFPYTAIFYANVVLEGATKSGKGTADWKNVQGQAEFFRGFAYWQLAQEFCRPYDGAAAPTDPGLVIRATSDLNAVSTRSPVAITYRQITTDLQSAVQLLPVNVPAKTRPGKAAAYAMLARVYLGMRDFRHAGLYADSALALYSTLMDYNTVPASPSVPFKRFNDEVIFHSTISSFGALQAPKYLVDTVLYAGYRADDLRKQLYFKPATGTAYQNFRGSYDGTSALFNGLSVDELYLTRAEAKARTGDLGAALADLNHLRKNRYAKATYADLVSGDAKTVLDWIIGERRKELLLRGLRWPDLRRLNMDADYRKTVMKISDGQRYELPPGDPRYVWPIPLSVVAGTGIAQNE
jgi:hypothetical protein